MNAVPQEQVTGGMLAHLRLVTRPAHDSLEGALGLLDEQLDLGAYIVTLQRFYGFWRLWEPHMTGLLHDEVLLGPRRRMHLLSADLAVLGLSPAAIAALPECPLPRLRDPSEAIGSLYVMAGSTLGGRIIQRHVAQRLGLEDGSGCSYFAGYGTETGRMWRSFLDRLNQEPMAMAGRIGDGASATFERLAWWLTGRREAGTEG